MAIYHFAAKVISRRAGRSATAAAAYRSGEKIHDIGEGKTHDYTKRQDVAHTEILAPDTAPDWMRDRSQLWNGVEAAEKRKDAQLSREVEFSLPRELPRADQIALAREFVQSQFVARGMVADLAIHVPKAGDGQEQPHAHVMLTTRELTGEGFGKKNREWNGKEQLGNWRESWANHANKALERAGNSHRIDHRSYEARRIDQEPTLHLGPTATQMERRGIQSERGQENLKVRMRNKERENWRESLARVTKELADLARQVVGGLARLRAAGEALAKERAQTERLRQAGETLRREKEQPRGQKPERKRTPDQGRGGPTFGR